MASDEDPTTRADELDALTLADAAEWEAWLSSHHANRQGVWLKIAKKGSGARTVDAAEGTEVALCFGWIDGHRKSLDETYFLQKYTPRRARSSWSKVNRDRVEALMAAGRMQPAGLDQVAAAKADGRWDAAYESQRTATVPADLEAALARRPAAHAAFDQLSKSERYGLILRLLKARTPEARARQLERIVGTLER
jgi:uncharacterized protein YdeI (YjbR/CyaY-like superfamily)